MGKQKFKSQAEYLESLATVALVDDEYEQERLKKEAQKPCEGKEKQDKVIQMDNLMANHMVNHLDTQEVNHMDTQNGEGLSKRLSKRSTGYPDGQPDGYPHGYPEGSPHENTPKKKKKAKVVRLSRQQIIIYDYLADMAEDGRFNATDAGRATGVPLSTVHKNIKRLKTLGVIDAVFDYKINKFNFKMAKNIEIDRGAYGYPHGYPHGQGDGQPSDVSDAAYISCCSSSLKNKTNNTRARAEDIRQEFETDPELRFFINRISPAQVVKWCELVQCGPDLMLDYLRWYRWNLVEGGQLNLIKKSVGGLFNHIMTESRAYERPPDYKSWAVKKQEEEAAAMAKRKAEAEALAEARKAAEKIAEDLAFEQFMSNPDADEYQAALKSIPTCYQRKPYGEAFSAQMRRAWRNL